MPTIWKTELTPADIQDIDVPMGAELLCAHEQHGGIAVWFRCDPDLPTEKRLIAVCATGSAVPAEDGRYLGSAFLRGGLLVYHVFEKKRPAHG